MKFFHGSSGMTSYDDMGQTAMDMIENTLAAEENGEGLRPLWEKVKKELSASRVSSTDGCLPGGNSTARMDGVKSIREDSKNETE